MLITRAIEKLGARVLAGIGGFGSFWLFSAYTLTFVPGELLSPRGWGRLLPQFYAIGATSVPVVMLTGAFVGMVLIVQGWAQFASAGLSDRLGAVVNITLTAELGPVLAGVMLAGRVGGALTAELGTMNVTEQLLALRSMGADPVRYLAAPRFFACLILTPLLTAYANLLGSLGAWVIYFFVYRGENEPYWHYIRVTVEQWDLGSGLFKSIFFGGTIGLVACFKGFHCRGGAEGVGQACTQSFVASIVTILVLDFFLGMAMNRYYELTYGFRPLL